MEDSNRLRARAGRLAPLSAVLALSIALPVSAYLAGGPVAQDDEPAESPAEGPDKGAEQRLAEAFQAAGVLVERGEGILAFPAAVEIRDQPLEYLLVNPHGAVHESMFVTPIDPEVLSAAFLTIGAEAGRNVEYVPVEPEPTREEVRSGAKTHDVIVPSGKPLYLYAGWREGAGAYDEEAQAFPDETVHFHRIEDLVLDLRRVRTLRRHGLVWLGSRMIEGREPGDPEQFAATVTGNLMCITFFSQGDTLLTMAVPECASQVDWVPNQFLLPERGSEVMVIASSTQLDVVPEGVRGALPFATETIEAR